jgi:hypothetical protein
MKECLLKELKAGQWFYFEDTLYMCSNIERLKMLFVFSDKGVFRSLRIDTKVISCPNVEIRNPDNIIDVSDIYK